MAARLGILICIRGEVHLVLYLILQPGHQVSLILQDVWGRLLVHEGLQTPIAEVKISNSGGICSCLELRYASILCDGGQHASAVAKLGKAVHYRIVFHLSHFDKVAIAKVCIALRVQQLADEVVVHPESGGFLASR